MVEGKFYGIGGEAFDDKIRDAVGAKPPYDDKHKDERDGIYLLPFGTVQSALSGDWKKCCHGSWRQKDPTRAPKIIDMPRQRFRAHPHWTLLGLEAAVRARCPWCCRPRC